MNQETINLIISKFKDGIAAKQISEELGVEIYLTYKILKQNGISKKNNIELKHKRIVEMFLSGVCAAKVAEAEKCKIVNVYKVLWKNGIDPNTIEKEDYRGQPEKFNEEQKKQICDMYIANISSRIIASKFNCTSKTIQNILGKMGIEKKQTEDRQVKFEQDVVNSYLETKSTPKTAAIFKIGTTTVYRILDKYNIDRSEADLHKMKIPLDKIDGVINEYQSGLTTTQLGEKYGVNARTIANVLEKNGVERRRKGKNGGVYKELSLDKIEELKLMWEMDFSMEDIMTEFNLTKITLYRWLKTLKVKSRRISPKGEEHGSWKGGKTITGSGYIAIWIPKDNIYYCMVNSQGYVPEHRYVMAQYLGRPITKEEQIHHRDGNKQNNSIENLQLVIGQHGAGQSYNCFDCDSNKITFKQTAVDSKVIMAYTCDICHSIYLKATDVKLPNTI